MNLYMKIDPSEQRSSLAGRCDFIGVYYYTRIRVERAKSMIPSLSLMATIFASPTYSSWLSNLRL